ncbi:MAG: prepilin-type N-terminal cleavage/methylation domain-containing protein [Planctomycetales bacterium]|nr:prepilin-type N-terminal cleavage/methylation domain-containing protein [Planctomycetales bacterium]
MRCVPKHSVGRNAFTLLELILVMILLCTVLAMAAPSLRGFFSSRKINDIAEQMLIMTRYARLQSICEGRLYRVNFDPTRREYWLSVLRDSAYERLGSSFGTRHSIPADIELTAEDVLQDGSIYYFEFNPQGYTKACSIALRDNRQNHVALVCYSPMENFELIEIRDDQHPY